MNTFAVYFKPRGPLASWPLASDTLFGAVCWGIRILGLMNDAQLEQWLEDNRASPPFAFSHAFPAFYSPDCSPIRFYPRPLSFQLAFQDLEALAAEEQQRSKTRKLAVVEATIQIKHFKKLAYVSEAVLIEIIQGQLSALDACKMLAAGQSNKTLLCKPEEAVLLPPRLYQTEAVQHNQIDRVRGATAEGLLFYSDETHFAPNCGLWALLRTSEEVFRQYIHPALRLLGDTGFGADTSTGKGHFEIQVSEAFSPPISEKPQAMMTVSHYLPAEGELNLSGSPFMYTLKILRPKRSHKFPRPLPEGMRSSPIYKQEMPVFVPGSVFPFTTHKDIYGQLKRLTPLDQEPVYQSGAALMIYLGGG